MIVDCAAYVEGKRVTASLELAQVAEWCARPGAFVWLGLRIPTRDELAEAFRVCGLEGDVDEVLAPHERAVLTSDGGITTLVLRTAHYNDSLEHVVLGEMSVIIGPGFVLTVRHGQASPLGGVRQELEEETALLSLGPPGVLSAIVHRVVDDFRPALDGFERDAVEAEADVFADDKPGPTKRIYRLRREVRELMMAIDALHDPLLRLARNHRADWPEEVQAELQEAIDQLARTVRRAHTLSDLLASALDANLAQVGVQQNEDMRKISAWVAIAAVPTMIAGIYGMNFDVLPELRWRFGYPLILAVMATACLLLYRSFRRSGWL